MMIKKQIHLFLCPALLMAAGSTACRLWPLDQRLSALFYSADSATWTGDSIQVVLWLLWYGDYPSIFLGMAAIWLAAVCVGSKKLEPWRRAGIYLMVSLALCHLLVNDVLKKHYNRARPRETVLFNGERPFAPVLNPPRADERGRSFPSGHAAAGFAFISIFFAFRRHHRGLAMAGLLLGLAHGLVNGLGRIAQGAHFPSDVLWSFGVVWFSCWALDHWWYGRWIRPRE